ncbi:hypothetical protein BK133_29105, partial [Paenibacillus sp. FSL H8-0548]
MGAQKTSVYPAKVQDSAVVGLVGEPAERNVGEIAGGLVWDSRKFTPSTTIGFPRTQAILHICSNFALFSLSELPILHICIRLD